MRMIPTFSEFCAALNESAVNEAKVVDRAKFISTWLEYVSDKDSGRSEFIKTLFDKADRVTDENHSVTFWFGKTYLSIAARPSNSFMSNRVLIGRDRTRQMETTLGQASKLDLSALDGLELGRIEKK